MILLLSGLSNFGLHFLPQLANLNLGHHFDLCLDLLFHLSAKFSNLTVNTVCNLGQALVETLNEVTHITLDLLNFTS